MKPPKSITAVMILLIITTAALVRIDTRFKRPAPKVQVRAKHQIENTLACDAFKWLRSEFSDMLIPMDVGPLPLAAMDGDLEKVKFLISRGASPGAKVIIDISPLQLAAACGHADIVEFLISSGADVNAPDALFEIWALHAASNATIAGILLRNGANPNATGGNRAVRPLSHFAGADLSGDATATAPFDRTSIELLLKYGADINAASKKSPSILTIAAKNYFSNPSPAKLDNTRWLIKKGAVPDIKIAVMLKDVALVKKLLASGADPGKNSRGEDSPLYLALLDGNTSAAKALIEAGADTGPLALYKLRWLIRNDNSAPDKPLPNGRMIYEIPKPPILKDLKPDYADAIISSDVKLAQKLLGGYAKNPKQPCGLTGERWLYFAALNGRTEIAKLMLRRGCNTPDIKKRALRCAVTSGNTETVAALLKAGASSDSVETQTAVEYYWIEPVKENNAGVERLLLDYIEEDFDKKSMLHFAAQRGDAPMIKFLISHGANFEARDKYGSTPLLYAAANNRISATRFLIDKGARVNAANSTGKTALHFAASQDTGVLMVKPLLSHGANVNATDSLGNTALHYAASADSRISTIKLLLSHGANIEARDNASSTPLLYAAANRAGKSARFLLDNGARVNAADKLNKTALHYAAENADPGLVRILLAAGANPNARHNDLSTPLMLSACSDDKYLSETKRIQVEKLLIQAGVKIHVAYSKGRTPLHCAAKLGRTAAAQLYISAGENINVTDAFGKTPLHLAIIFGSTSTAKTLVRLGAKTNLKDASGKTPMQYVEHPLQADAARSLDARGARINLKTAILMADTPLIQKALISGASVNSTDEYSSPLNDAVKAGHSISNIELLLSSGARFSHNENLNYEIFWRMSLIGGCRLIPALMERIPKQTKEERDTDEPEKSVSDFTLNCASRANDVELVRKTILKSSAAAKAEALNTAISINNLEMTRIIITAGIDKKALKEAFDDDTPLKLAEENGSAEIAALLRRHGYVK